MLSFLHTPLYGLFLISTLIFYAFFGSPTPDSPGFVEGFIALGLMLSVGFNGFVQAVNLKNFRTPFLKSLQIIFLYGLVVPTISALFHHNDLNLILRDLVAFMFLGLPLFLSSRISNSIQIQKYFFWSLMAIGTIFSIRTLLPVLNIWIPQGELLYLSNSPLVLMTAIFCVLCVWKNFKEFSVPTSCLALFALFFLVVVMAAMILDVQRATIGAVFISLVFLFLMDFIKHPKKIILPSLLIFLIIVMLWSSIIQIFDVMAVKTATVGMNSRIAEASAVLDWVKSDMGAFLFGRGWGAVFSSPAVAGLDVNYTHSLLTTMFLKGGFVMLVCTMGMVVCALYDIFSIFRKNPVKGIVSFWVLVIPVFLYASHKSLDFGLAMLMIGVWSINSQSLQKDAPSVKKR